MLYVWDNLAVNCSSWSQTSLSTELNAMCTNISLTIWQTSKINNNEQKQRILLLESDRVEYRLFD